ncbi:hypothetical protein BGZ80_010597 [Entomortierella chlamydospora]|uniref:PAS domain-containing protein n=1 Tax=Entomortierella chlamydospora TaxID=101097 RepID=A0A9P6SZM1_9FUNG|nr:hypothetical protein BGZ80_010597 [Entomortierella chlamydospora]
MASLMGSEKEELERISRNHKNVSSTWNPAKLDMELRACLFLNRFTRNLCVMYASPSCEMVLDLDPDDLLGKPLLLYIRADDLASFVAQADLAKSTATVRHLRFWFQSPNCRQEIPLEAIFLGAADALVAVFRRCLPFRRKQFITNFSSQEYSTRRNSGKFSRNYSFSSRISRSRGSSFERSEPYGRIRHVYSIRDSPTDTFSSSSSSISSTQNQGTRSYQASLQNVPVGSISSIRSLDKEQARLRPLTSFHEEETDVLKSKAKHLLREFRTQDSEVETCLVEEFEKVRLVPDRTKAIRRERGTEEEEHSEVEDDDYYDEVPEITIPDESIEEILMPYSMRRHWKEE